ncbi:MAG: Ig-like domain-containing protein [Thermoplasmata archaeon]|nr:MAG: Ig-like domain-containing protein [Thermoplasmata archaeon]
MCGHKARRTFRVCICVLLILSVVQVIPFDEPFIGNVSADESWVQTTAGDFNSGTLTNVTVTPTGEVKLALQSNYVEDDFIDESKISYKDNITVDTALGEARLIKFNRTFGGNDHDNGILVQQTSEDGYILVGETVSYGDGVWGDVWLIKTDSNGIEQWNRTFGGGFWDYGRSVHQTSDLGYIIAANTNSFGNGGSDAWLIKTDENGHEEWNMTFGGNGLDWCTSFHQTSDGGYIIAGMTESYGGTEGDAWLIKTTSSGNELWNRTYGDHKDMRDAFHSVQQTSDGGYIATGYTWSFGPGWEDLWLLKTDSSGNEYWNWTFGAFSSDSDAGTSVRETSDRGFIITGRTKSYGAGNYDVWLIKTDINGSEEWKKTFGGIDDDRGQSVVITNDGDFVIAGLTKSFGSGLEDLWLIKTDSTGSEIWNKTFGGGRDDYGYSVSETSDFGYIITGTTDSYGAGAEDVWLLKTDSLGNLEFTYGELISSNLLEGQEVVSLTTFECTVSIPTSGSGSIYIEFSEDLNNWDGGQLLNDGFNSIDLSSLDFTQGNFYYRMIFQWYGDTAPSVQNINFSFSQYYYLGVFESQSFDATAPVRWVAIKWNGTTVSGLDFQFQLRTASDESGLDLVNYIGRGGTSDTYYTSPGEEIYPGHNGDQWMQFRVFLRTADRSLTPLLEDVTIFYNFTLAYPPDLISPSDGSLLSDTTPEFSWRFNDIIGSQIGFQVQISDADTFSDIIYDSDLQTSSNEHWQITGDIDDGTWYWRVRTQNDVLDWGDYSTYWTFVIDSTPPYSFTPTADYDTWTSETQFNIYFSTTDKTSSIDRYEVKIDSGAFSTQTSPYTIPAQTDGIHNITVRAYDKAGNYVEGYRDIYIDTGLPSITHTPVTSGEVGEPIEIEAIVEDVGSGLDEVILYYKKPSDSSYIALQMNADTGDTYSVEIPGAAVTSDGLEYYISASDQIPNIIYYGTSGQTTTEPTGSNDIDIEITQDIIPPSITGKTPTGTNVAVTTNITVTFSEPMNQLLTQSAFTILPSVFGAFSWNGNTLKFDPDSDLAYFTTYNVTIGTGAKDLFGNPLGTVTSWEFTTIPEPGTGPEVETIDPEKNELDVGVGIQIEIKFTQDMDPDTTEGAITIEPYIELIPQWGSEDYLVLKPREPLDYDTKYTLTISIDATNENGQHMEEEYVSSFYTEKRPEEAAKPFWETWEPIITGVTVLASIIVFLIGFLAVRKKRGKLKQYMERIEDTFDEYKEDPKTCKEELILLREDIKKDVHRGKIEENHFLILDKKIDDFLLEIKVMEKGEAEAVPEEDITEPVSEEEEVSGGFE